MLSLLVFNLEYRFTHLLARTDIKTTLIYKTYSKSVKQHNGIQ